MDKNRSRRARDIEDRIENALGGRRLIYTVLTVPPRLRGALRDKATWKKAIGRLVAYMKKYLDFDFGLERSDPCGDLSERWHPHVNLLWARKDGAGYLAPEALEGLKSRWKRIVGEHEENPVSVYTHFAKPEARELRQHWYSYLGRTWPAWEEEFPYHCRLKWLGRPPKAPEREHNGCCSKCGLEVAVVRTGTLEEAVRLAGRGYEVLLLEQRERIQALKRGARCKRPREVGGVLMPAWWFTSGLCEDPSP